MKPCVVCGEKIKKKDSVMTMVYVCSIECKNKRKATLPKKVSITSWKYWINKGYSEKQAKEKVSTLQSQRSPRTINYWINKGYDKESAQQKLSEYQQKLSLKNIEKYSREERQKRTTFSEKYWINKGYTEEQAKEILRENSNTVSLSAFKKRYGATLGSELYQKLCANRKKEYTLKGYQERHGEKLGKQLWSKKYKNRHNSLKACQFFEKLIECIGPSYKIYTAGNENGEYGVLNRDLNEYYFYDFVIPELKLCVEYHGDYWHCNPKKYHALYEHKQSGLFAKDIWEKDNIKKETIISGRGFSHITVWESDNPEEKINFILEKINEFKKSKD